MNIPKIIVNSLRSIADEIAAEMPQEVKARAGRTTAAHTASTTRSQLTRTLLNKPVTPELVEEEDDQPNKYQKMLNKFGYRPFSLEDARRIWKGATRIDVHEVLKGYQAEKLAQPLDDAENDWILLRA